MYSVKELADLAGVSRRTLHYYDEIGLLAPTEVQENGYRAYDRAAPPACSRSCSTVNWILN